MSSTLGIRLKQRRDELNLTQEELAYLTGITRVGITKIELDQTKNARADTLFSLAAALKCNPYWLLYGKGDKENVYHPTHSVILKHDQAPEPVNPSAGIAYSSPKKLPILTFDMLSKGVDGVDFNSAPESDFFCPVSASPRTFAIKVREDSMAPPFFEDEILIVDPDKEAQSNDYVVVSVSGMSEPVFKQFQVLDGIRMLRATNPNYPSELRYLKMDESSHFLGVIVSHIKPIK